MASMAMALVGCRPAAEEAAKAEPRYGEVMPGSVLLYVSPHGDDGAIGDEAHPLRTIAAALEKAEPGTVIRLAPGEYRERPIISTRATAEAPLIIEGARDANGKWLSFVDGSTVLEPAAWRPEPEVGPGVYSAAIEEPRLLLVNGQSVARLHPSILASWVETNLPREDGAPLLAQEVLAWPDDFRLSAGKWAQEAPIPFWETLGGVYSPKENGLYLRLAGGVDPRTHVTSWAKGGPTVRLIGASHVTLRHLAIQGGEYGIELVGANTVNNSVEDCFIRNGRRRVRIARGAEGTRLVRNQVEMGFIGKKPGAWGMKKGVTAVVPGVDEKQFLYRFFKYWASSVYTSDDVSIIIELGSRDTVVEDNTLDTGIIGIGLYGGDDVRIKGNRIRHFSSVGTVVRDGGVNAEYDGNLFYDCNLNIRLHVLNHPKGPLRHLRFTRNVSIQQPGVGTHVFCHFIPSDHLERAYRIDAGTTPYPEHKVLFAWNTFYGGSRGIALPNPDWAKQGVPGFHFVNNRFVDCSLVLSGRQSFYETREWWGTFDYNEIIGGQLGSYGKNPVWFGEHNAVEASADGWSAGWEGVTPPEEMATPRWLDLSRGFTVGGESFPSLPNPEPLPFYVHHPAR